MDLPVKIKSILFLVFLSFSLSSAEVLDAIAINVDGEAITTAEIATLQNQLEITKKEAVEMLIQDRLQKVAIRGIEIDQKSVDERVEAIAKQNNVSVLKMREIVTEQGTEWSEYRKKIQKTIQQENFIREKVMTEPLNPTEEDLKSYYLRHQDDFKSPATIQIVEYTTQEQKTMEQFLGTGKGIEGKAQTLQADTANPALVEVLLATKEGSFTEPFNAGDRFVIYKVISKSTVGVNSFESAREAVLQKWMITQQEQRLKEYFEKLRSSIQIEIIRE